VADADPGLPVGRRGGSYAVLEQVVLAFSSSSRVEEIFSAVRLLLRPRSQQ
jgi:hypothetical protein